MNIIQDIVDSDNIVDKFNELRKGLLKSNLMVARTPHTIIYWTGNSNTISISGTNYTAQADKVNIDGVEYYQLALDKDLDNNFYSFTNNTFTNLIFKDVDTSNVTNMNGMFYRCINLTSLDLSGWNTSNVTNMNSMFNSCNNLTYLNLAKFDISNVSDITSMFNSCGNLNSLDLSGWDTSKVTNMNKMFKACSALKTIRMVGCSQPTIDKIKAQLATDGITDCTIVTE